MEMDDELRRHIIALFEIMIKHDETAGLTEERLSKAEQELGLSREVLRKAIEYLVERGLAKPTFSDPKLKFGVMQLFITDPGRLYYHQLLESSRAGEVHGLHSSLIRLSSLRSVAWIFAGLVFGGYVVSLVAALLQSVDNFGVAVYVILSFLANMIFPISLSILAWVLASVLLFVRQFLARPIQWLGVVIGGASTLLSVITFGAAWVSLSATHVSWFVSFLQLEPSTKLVVGFVSAVALGYVILSPKIWREWWFGK